MRTIDSKSPELEEILKGYSEGIVFIKTDIPKGELLADYNAKQKGKVKNLTISLYNSALETTNIEIVGTDKVSKELKDFLEKTELVTFYMTFDIKVLLTFGVNLNIVYDVQAAVLSVTNKRYKLGNALDLGSEICITDTLPNTPDVQLVALLYHHYKDKVLPSKYVPLFKATKMFAIGDYFGISNDISKEYLDKYLAEQADILRYAIDYWVDNYKIHLKSNRLEVLSVLSKIADVPIHGIPSMQDIPNILCKDASKQEEYNRAVRYYKNYLRSSQEIKRVEKGISSQRYITDDFGMVTTKFISDILPKKNFDMIRTNPKNHYYISVESTKLYYKYLEKVCNNVDISEGLDYFRYIASSLFEKPESEISQKERSLAKMYSFFRLALVVPIFWNGFRYSSSYRELEPYVKQFGEKLPPFNIKNKEPISFNMMILNGLANVYDVCKDSLDIIFIHREYDALIFRVSNKVNPYRAMKLLGDAMDTTESIGIRLFDTFSIGNDMLELDKNMDIVTELEDGRRSYESRINYDCVAENFAKIKQEKLRNVVQDVLNDIK